MGPPSSESVAQTVITYSSHLGTLIAAMREQAVIAHADAHVDGQHVEHSHDHQPLPAEQEQRRQRARVKERR